jgi:hypothetical protein
MTIVTYRHRPKPKRPKKAVTAVNDGNCIVRARKPGKGRKARSDPGDDPVAEARVAAFFGRMIQPQSDHP